MENFTKTHTYTVTNYFDVWGNAKDGWEVNNQCIEFNDLVITDDATKKDICEYLVKRHLLATSDQRRLYVENLGDRYEIYERKGMKPLFGISLNY